jgi:hypothetical protein
MTAFYKSQSLLWRALVAILFAIAYLFVEAHAAPSTTRAASAPAAKAKQAAFDHSRFNAILATAVSGGRVDYAKFKNNASFNAYLASLGTASVASLPGDEQLAFWINAYNAFVIKNVLDNPGMRRPTDVTAFFDVKKFKAAGRTLSLNDIENTIIRKQFRTPLIHFGLVCAARSCPPLLPSAYSGATVRAQLARNASAYLASQYNRYDASTQTLSLSKILDWYKDDFGGEAGIKTFVKQYGTAAMKQALAAGPNVRVGYMEYDWTLNAK